MKYDFGGYATKANLQCSDGRVIMQNAFKDADGQTVPLVWGHAHDDPSRVLGHAMLENRNDGVYAYCTLNETDAGNTAKELIRHGDVKALSIYANKLKHNGNKVLHGAIREVSLVLAGANPGAYIDSVLLHGEECLEDGIIYSGEPLELAHADNNENDDVPTSKEETVSKKESEKTIQDVLDTFTEEQKNVMYAIIGSLVGQRDGATENDEEDNDMKHNVFDINDQQEDVLSHDAMEMIIGDAKRYGSLKESFLAHADEYGIENIDYLFPDAQSLDTPPGFIQRNMDWVQKVMGAVHHTPFSRIKSMFADITEDEARAKGYIKGKLKKEEVFSLLKRTTTPTTIYKKQKLDRDDTIDITDFDVIAWLKSEMRLMLDEEIARAVLIGDGRLSSSDDKINEQNIRPILNDEDLFVIRWSVANGSGDEDKAKNFIRAAVKARKNYKGSGLPTLYTTEDLLTDMLLLEDGIGHKLYKTEAELATALRVSDIVTVSPMENRKDKDEKDVYGIIVNLNDYNVGADKGGAINMFDDFDIDYNQMKYLIETRCSGALTKPFSAIVLRSGNDTKSEEPGLIEAKKALA